MTESEWVTSYEDVGDIAYGGFWVRHHGDYADFLEVTDLDSAAGARGMVLVERGSIGLYTRGVRAAVRKVRQAIDCYGSGLPETWRTMPRIERHAFVWEALRRYHGGDVDSPTIVQPDPDGPNVSEGWHADLRLDSTDALADWLVETYGIPVPTCRQRAA